MTMTAPGMAAADAPYRQPEAFQQAVLLECLNGIVGACRRKAALGSQQRRYHPLVDPDQANQGQGQYFKQFLHEPPVFSAAAPGSVP